MERTYKTLFFCIILGMLNACSSPSVLSPEELSQYLLEEKNGVHKVAEIANTRIEVTYRPTDLFVQQEIGDAEVDTATINKFRKKYDPYYYFIVSLSRNNKEALHQAADFSEYSELVQTMSFRMPQYVTLTTAAQDTIPVGDFMLNRTYGMSASTDILFAFNKEKAHGNEWIQLNLNEFGLGVGNQRFRFRTKDLEVTPGIYKHEFKTKR